jgi:hypothetical protein
MCEPVESAAPIARDFQLKYTSLLARVVTLLHDAVSTKQIATLEQGKRARENRNHQQMHSFIINRNTLLHVSTLLDHLQGDLFCYRYTKVAL